MKQLSLALQNVFSLQQITFNLLLTLYCNHYTYYGILLI